MSIPVSCFWMRDATRTASVRRSSGIYSSVAEGACTRALRPPSFVLLGRRRLPFRFQMSSGERVSERAIRCHPSFHVAQVEGGFCAGLVWRGRELLHGLYGRLFLHHLLLSLCFSSDSCGLSPPAPSRSRAECGRTARPWPLPCVTFFLSRFRFRALDRDATPRASSLHSGARTRLRVSAHAFPSSADPFFLFDQGGGGHCSLWAS
ncbi:hypothetical protein K438DRAFT_543881 [Mycena galopus ATCC 62051]|nr:hypothetical protein K438DRAFT_543881 [Mycena galopus ATCC 62051]